MKVKENKVLWWSTRVLSILIIVFSIVLFLAYTLFPESEEIKPYATKEIIGFIIVAIGFIGLLLAWKWEIPGAIISLIAVFPKVLIPSPMYIWPGTAILFIVLWKRRKNKKIPKES